MEPGFEAEYNHSFDDISAFATSFPLFLYLGRYQYKKAEKALGWNLLTLVVCDIIFISTYRFDL